MGQERTLPFSKNESGSRRSGTDKLSTSPPAIQLDILFLLYSQNMPAKRFLSNPFSALTANSGL